MPTNPERFLLYFTRQELDDAYIALCDAEELIDEKLESGRKHGDYEEEDMQRMREELKRFEALRQRFERIMKDHTDGLYA